MSSEQPTPVPATRDPVSHGRAFVEGAVFLTPLATLVAWLVTFLPVEVPAEVQSAFVGLLVTIGTLCFSEWRNRQYQLGLLRPTALVLLPVLLLLGCVTWDGPTLRSLAGDEIVALMARGENEPLQPERCAAMKRAALALRNAEGDSRSLNAPFFSGQKISELAGRFDRLGSACYEAAARDRARGMAPTIRSEIRADYVRAWQDGRALAGGGEEE